MQTGRVVCVLDGAEGVAELNTIYLDSCAKGMQGLLDKQYYLKLCSQKMECIVVPVFTVLHDAH